MSVPSKSTTDRRANTPSTTGASTSASPTRSSTALWPSRTARCRSRRRAPPRHRPRPRPPRSNRWAPRSPLRRRTGCCWRAGFGPTPGQAEALAGQPLQQVVYGLTRPSGPATLSGPEPTDEEGNPLDSGRRLGRGSLLVARSHGPLRPAAGGAHDVHLARLVRELQREGQQPAADARPERPVPRTWRSAASTTCSSRSPPTRRCWCSSTASTTTSDEPNENYAREMMELFSLGADRGAYTEDDVREMARALTGWRAEWSEERGPAQLPLRSHRHDTGAKTVFGQTRQLELGRRGAPVRHPPAARLVLRDEAVGLLHPDAAGRSDARVAAGPLHRLGLQHPRGASRRSCSTPTSTKAPSS